MITTYTQDINKTVEHMTRGSAGSGLGSIIFVVVFLVIILSLIVVATIGSRKDALDKLIENDKKKKVIGKATTDRIKLYTNLYDLIISMEKELDDFKPSVGTRSIGDINKEGTDLLKSILKSESLSGIYESSDLMSEIKPILDDLSKSKPTNWAKESQFGVNLVKAKFESISKNPENKKLIEEGRKTGWK